MSMVQRADSANYLSWDESGQQVISKDLIKEFCNKALLLEGGTIKFFGDVEEALALYQKK